MAEVVSLDPIELVYCCAQADKELLNKLQAHLTSLIEKSFMKGWSDLEVSTGCERGDSVIKKRLLKADVILLLVSVDFMTSSYYNKKKFMKVIENRRNNGETFVVLIYLRDVDWKQDPLNKLLTPECPVLLSEDKPVISDAWSSEDNAFKEVAKGLSKIFRYVWLKKGDNYYKAGEPERALLAYKQAIELDHDFAPAYTRKGAVLRKLGKDQEAKAPFDTAISLNPMDANAHYLLGTLLYDYKDYDRAISSFENALQLNDSLVSACIYKGSALAQQGKNEDARNVYDDYLKRHRGDLLVAYFEGELNDRSETKVFYERTQQVVRDFLSVIEREHGFFYRERRSSSYEEREPMQVFIHTIHIFRQGMREFQEVAVPLARRYSYWLKDFHKTLKDISAQKHVISKNPEIQELLRTLLEMEERQLEERAKLIDKIINYLKSLKKRRLYQLDDIIRVVDTTLEEIAHQLEEQERESQKLLEVVRSDAIEDIFRIDMKKDRWSRRDDSYPSASPINYPY